MDRFFGLDRPAKSDDGVVLLTTVHDEVEKNLLCGILEEEKITFLVKDRGSGEAVRILAGFSMFGCDIYVPEELFDEANALLEAYRNGEVLDEEALLEYDEDGEEEDA